MDSFTTKSNEGTGLVSFINSLIENEKLNALITPKYMNDEREEQSKLISFKEACQFIKDRFEMILSKQAVDESNESILKRIEQLPLSQEDEFLLSLQMQMENTVNYEMDQEILREQLVKICNLNCKSNHIGCINEEMISFFPVNMNEVVMSIIRQCAIMYQLIQSNDPRIVLQMDIKDGKRLFHIICESGTLEMIQWLTCTYGAHFVDNAQIENYCSANLNHLFSQFIKHSVEKEDYSIQNFITKYQWFRDDIRYNTHMLEDNVPTLLAIFCASNLQVVKFLAQELTQDINLVEPHVKNIPGLVFSKCSMPVLEYLTDNFISLFKFDQSENDNSSTLETMLIESDDKSNLLEKVKLLVDKCGVRIPDNLLVSVIVTVDITEYLVEKNPMIISYINEPDKRTPLMHASQYGSVALVEYLVKKSSNIFAVDSKGKNALDYALKWKRIEQAAVLIKAGAKFIGELSQILSDSYADYTPILKALIETGQLNPKNADTLEKFVNYPKAYIYLLSQGAVPTIDHFFSLLLEDNSHLISALLRYAPFDANVLNQQTGDSVIAFCIKNRLENNLSYLLQHTKATEKDLFLIPHYFDKFEAERIVRLLKSSGVNIEVTDSKGRNINQLLEMSDLSKNAHISENQNTCKTQ
jgi:hypothetical protein